MIYGFLKKIQKPIKYGIKYSKGLVTAYSLATQQSLSDRSTFMGQFIGMVVTPFIYLLVEPYSKKLTKAAQEKLPLAFYGCIALGSSIGTCLSSTLFAELPSNFSDVTGLLAAATIVPVVVFAIPACVALITHKLGRNKPQNMLVENSVSLTDKYSYQLGLEAGLVIGSALGASCEYLFPGFGLLASGLGGIFGITAGIVMVKIAPNLLLRLSKKVADQEQDNFSGRLLKSIKIGTLIGTCIGVVVGTFLLPGLGTTLGGVIGAGVAGVVLGSFTALTTRFSNNKIPFVTYLLQKSYLSRISFEAKLGITVFSLVGALIGTFLLPGLGTVAGAAVGGLVGCVIGLSSRILFSFFTFNQQNHSRERLEDNDQSSTTQLPFYKSAKLGVSIGASTGALIGSVIGSFIPVIGTVLGGLIGAFIGATIGITIPGASQLVTKVRNSFEKNSLPNLDIIAPQKKPSYEMINLALTLSKRNYQLFAQTKEELPVPNVEVGWQLKVSFSSQFGLKQKAHLRMLPHYPKSMIRP
jgi:hypothetical protein